MSDLLRLVALDSEDLAVLSAKSSRRFDRDPATWPICRRQTLRRRRGWFGLGTGREPGRHGTLPGRDAFRTRAESLPYRIRSK